MASHATSTGAPRAPADNLIDLARHRRAKERAAYQEAIAKRPDRSPELMLILGIVDVLQKAGIAAGGPDFVTSLMCRMSSAPVTEQPDDLLRAGNLVSDLVMRAYPEGRA
ncbi:MAG TPA: hypothetical protein VGR32_10115 [Brevundimonas sp.]|jgi:hypothetical protein|uniref:hypothetical protein n=1 Tax=Brevundimonas sp. TaxID=1871086 RepID=UPI002DE670E1|nr:hypothetical protein [Brevundimonas sp.]